MNGFVERLKSELEKLLPNRKINIIARPQRIYDVWEGGVVMGSMIGMCYWGSWISREEYDESGPYVVYRKILNNYYK